MNISITEEAVFDKTLLILVVLTSLVAMIAATVFQKKAILLGFSFTPTSISTALIYVFADIISEIYGKKQATFILVIVLISNILFSFIVYALISFPSPHNWYYQSYFDYVFKMEIWVTLIGGAAIIFSIWVNIILLTYLKKKCSFFFPRAVFSTALSELLFCFFILIGFSVFRLIEWNYLWQMVMMSYLLKLGITFIASIPSSFVVFFIKKKKGLLKENKISVNPYATG
jgi:uncharacterized integral membrane protein (TIGR00697 family)